MSQQHDEQQLLPSIPYIDASSIDDEETSERKQSSSDFSRTTSLSESDPLGNLNKQMFDHQSDDDILFLEWDKERQLFQDYINSLRKEIRVLLQERLEYQQQQISQELKQTSDEQMKIDLLQKSLEEKNFVIEQLQTEYELTKDKNTNLIRKISLVQCDTKSYIGIIDELKQKISDLTIDLQNHVLVKRRLEMSINNLENDCKMIDAERIRLTNDIKQNQHEKQDLEKFLQKANVQIAEQGSTIEMLRSENVQVRSQLSTIQRRMFQEKQQIMDYLRQIENDLIEKEQIKQRESSLRQDYEQLKSSIHQDQQKIEELQQECSQLLNTIQNQNEEKNLFQSEVKHLYSHFHIPIDRHNLSLENIIPPIESRFNDLQKQCDTLTDRLHELQIAQINPTGDEGNQKSDIEDELRHNLEVLTAQCGRLEKANQAWQEFHQSQLDNFRHKFRNNLSPENHFSLEEIAQSLADYLNQLLNERDHHLASSRTHEIPFSEVSLSQSANGIPITPSDEVSLQSTPSLINDHDTELRQLREKNALLTTQCAQLDEANRAWEKYQLTQLDFFRDKLRDYLPLEENTSFDQAAQLMVDQIKNEREEFRQQYRELEKANVDLRSELSTNLETIKQSYINTIDELTKELSILKEELDQPKQQSFDEIAQQIDDQFRREREEINERYQVLEEENRNLRLESENNLETIRQSYLNTIDELNRELLAVKEQFAINHQESDTQTTESSSSSSESNIDDINPSIDNLIKENNLLKEKELSLTKDLEYVNQQLLLGKQDQQVQDEYLFLQNQCTQLDNANQAWQQFYDNQLDLIRNQLKDYLDFDQNLHFSDIIQTIADEFEKRNHPENLVSLETTSNGNGLSRQSSLDSQQIETLQEEIESLENQLKDSQSSIDSLKNTLQLITYENEQLKQDYQEIEGKYYLLIKTKTNLPNPPIEESPTDEIQQLQGHLSLLTEQCSQLNEANRAWEQFHQNQLGLFREKLHESILTDPNSSLEQIAQDILHQFDSLHKQLLNYQSSESVLDQNLEDLTLKLADVHKQCEEIREQNAQLIQSNQQLLLENDNLNKLLQRKTQSQSTQVDPIEMIHQENQTESLCSITDDENSWNLDIDNERLQEYIEQISSLPSTELSNQLHRECEQILSKQNLTLSSLSHLEPDQLALVTLYSLSNQHLIDEAKQLYNETVLRALKQEYELINNEKNDLIQQIESNSLQSNERFDDPHQEEIPSETNDWEDISSDIEQTQVNDQQPINDDSFQLMKNKLEQIVNERSELFPDMSADPIERLDRLVGALEHQTAQTDVLKKESPISRSRFSEEDIEQLIEERDQAREDTSAIDKENEKLKLELYYRDQQIVRLSQELSASATGLGQMMDHETQTDDQQEEKSVQINAKLKRALQTIKEKMNRVVHDRPDLFPQMSGDTIERIETLVSTMETQAKQIEHLQNDRDHAQQEINDLRSSFDYERSVQAERLESQAPLVEDYRKQIEERNALVEHQNIKSSESQHEIEQLKEEITQLQQTEASLDEDIQSSKETIEQQSKELKDLSGKYLSLVESHDEVNRQKEEGEKRLNEYQNQIDHLMDELQKKTLPSIQTTDNESQTDDRQHDKLMQVNNKLKRALQAVKEKVQRVVSERPDLFDGVGEETSDRLDHLISTIENQATEIDVLHAERDQVEKQLSNEIKLLQSALEASQNELDDERQMKMEQPLSSPLADNGSSEIEICQKQIDQLQRNLSQKEEERTLLREHLNEVELELRKISDDHTSTLAKYESLVDEHDALLKERELQSTDSERQIEQLKAQLVQLQQPPDSHPSQIQADVDIDALYYTIDHQSQQLKDLNDKTASLSSQLQSQVEERLKEIESKALSHVQTADHESQTDDRQYEKMVQMNNKLKRALQAVKEKMQRVASERPDLFDGVGEETSERLDHMIATVEHQAVQVNALQTERNQSDEEHQRQIKELQSSLEASQYELENERQVRMERLVSSAPPSAVLNDDINSVSVEEYEKQIKQLQQSLSQKDDERTLLRDRLNDVELELRKTLDDHALMTDEYEALIKKQNILVEQQTHQSVASQHEIEQLKEQLATLQQVPATNHIQIQTEEDINSLYELVEQQSEQMKDLNEKNSILSSQVESLAELDRQKKTTDEKVEDYQHQIENLIQERTNLLEEIEKKTLPSIQTTDNESQTDDRQHDKLMQVNNKLKRALQTVKEKVQRVVSERPDLFDGVGEETSDRLDHLIATIENQAIQIDVLHAERDQVEKQLSSEIKLLQSALETSQNELDDERQMKKDELLLSPADESSSVIENYQKQIEELQQNLLQKEEEQSLLQARLNEVDVELRNTLEDHTLKSTKYEENLQSLIEEQTIHSKEHEHAVEHLKRESDQIRVELAELRRPIDYHQAETQTDENIDQLHAVIKEQTEQLQTLNDKYRDLSSQIESNAQLQVEAEKQRNENEQQISDYKDQIKNFDEERRQLLEEIEKKTLPSIVITDSEGQTDDDQREKLLQSALETSQNELDDERRSNIERVSSQSEDQSAPVIEDYQKQIEKLQENLSKKENEQILLSQRLNESESELQKTIDDHALKSKKYEEDLQSLIDQRTSHSEEQLKKENDQIREELTQSIDGEHREIQTDEDITALHALIEQQAEQLKNFEEKCIDLTSQVDSKAQWQIELDQQRKETEQKINDYRDLIENLMQERATLLEEIEKKTMPVVDTSDSDNQTDDDRHEELVLTTLKEKIDQVATDRPDLFDDVNEETNERLDHLIATIENQATQISGLQADHNRVEEELRNEIEKLQSSLQSSQSEFDNERRLRMEQLSSRLDDNSASIIEDFQKQIDKLQQNLLEKDNERNLLSERLGTTEDELRKALDDLKFTVNERELLSEERDALAEQQIVQSAGSEREIEQLKEQLVQLQQSPHSHPLHTQPDVDIDALHHTIDHQSQQLKDLTDKTAILSSQLQSQAELISQKKALEERLKERENLLEEIEKKTAPSIQTIDNGSQTDDHRHEKMLQLNKQLKSALQSVKDQIHGIARDKPEIFEGVGEDTNELLDHLISTVGNQATQLDLLRTERYQVEEQLQKENNELQSSLDACQYQIENESSIQTEQLPTAPPAEEISSSVIEEYQKEIDHLRQNLSQKSEQETLLREHLAEVELELKKTLDDQKQTIYEYQSLAEEKDALVEQQALHSAESQREIEQLKKELVGLKQSPTYQHMEIQTEENMKVLDEMTEHLKDLNEKNALLSSQLESQAELQKQKQEMEEQLSERNNQIDHLMGERVKLLEDIEKNTPMPIQTKENEVQTDDDEHEKILDINNSLTSKLQTIKDERPDLFGEIDEEAHERLDRLISSIKTQATQIDLLRTEHNQVKEQLRKENNELQSSLEACQYQIENQRSIQTEQLLTASPAEDTSLSVIEDYQKEVDHLRQNLCRKSEEETLLREHLAEVELELKKTLDDQARTTHEYQSLAEEKDALVEQQALHSAESQREIEQLKKELGELKQSPDYQHTEIQTEENMKVLDEMTEHLKDLNEKNLLLSSQLESQADLHKQKQEMEEQLTERNNQIDHLMGERVKFLEDIEKNTPMPIQTKENEMQTDDDEHEKILDINNSLTSKLQTIKDERPDLFGEIDEEAHERLDRLISSIKTQATQIDLLCAEHQQVEEQLRKENNELQSSLEACQYQIENERSIQTEQLLTAPPSEDTSSSVIEDYQKEVDHLRQNLSQKSEEGTLLREHLAEVELELKKTLDDQARTTHEYQSLAEEKDALVEQQALDSAESQREIEQLKKELGELKQSPDYQHMEIQTEENMKVLDEMTEHLKDLTGKNVLLSSQLESQADLQKQKQEIEEQLSERNNQINHLMGERVKLLGDIEKNTPMPIQTKENEVQTDDDEHEKILDINNSLTSALQTIKDERPDLFVNMGEEPDERLDRLILSIKTQATQIAALQVEHDQTKLKHQDEINELENSFDLYRQQTHEQIASLTPITHEIETQTIDSSFTDNSRSYRTATQSDDSELNGWFDASPDVTEKEDIDHQQYPDIDTQYELENSSALPLSTDNSTQTEMADLSTKIQQITLQYPTLLSNSNENPSESLDQINSLLQNLQTEIKDLQNSFNTYRNDIENERLIQMEKLEPCHAQTQTLGLSMYEEHEKRLAKLQENELVHQREIERLIEERDQARDLLTQLNNLPQQTSQLTSHPVQIDVETQTINDPNSDQGISRRIFEQEMLAWSKESEQLKRFVKQIQIENNKLKDNLQQFEAKINDYIHENERLKQENHHLSWTNYSTMSKENFTTSDEDVCYLTLKWLTYEVAQRNEPLIVRTNESEQEQKQLANDTERQMKNLRVQNERLKNQLETYTIQFKHIQHAMSAKIQEMLNLKDELERLRTNEMQSRLEIDRLQSELENDQSKIQGLECELSDLKLKQSSKDNHSIDNLRELLELKERELNALKEKLDYTKQTHKIELQETQKANQFSLDNVKRFERMDLCHEEKRRDLETRLGKFCRITRPLITNQQLFIQNPILNIEELRKLIAETETEERVTNSLSPIRDCLSLLEGQMKDLHHSIIENHARRSKRWKYRLGFECLSCESRWEVTHDIRDLQEACLDPARFLESSMVEPMAGCSCPIMIDFVESDIRLCLDDMINDVCLLLLIIIYFYFVG